MRDALLQEREKIIKELDSVENVLMTRYGWNKDSATKAPCVVAKPETSSVDSDSHAEGSGDTQIQYSNEFRIWLSQRQGSFTINDFRDYLVGKYDESIVNNSSIRTPFRTEEATGEIVLIAKGAGRKPTIYASKNYRPPPPPLIRPRARVIRPPSDELDEI